MKTTTRNTKPAKTARKAPAAAAAAVPVKRPPNDRGQGRKALDPEERTTVGSIRLKPAQWAKYHALGGNDWLRQRLDAARQPAGAAA